MVEPSVLNFFTCLKLVDLIAFESYLVSNRTILKL